MKNILTPLVGLSCLLFFSTTTRAQGLIDGFQKGGGNFDLALSYSYEQYSDFYGYTFYVLVAAGSDAVADADSGARS